MKAEASNCARSKKSGASEPCVMQSLWPLDRSLSVALGADRENASCCTAPALLNVREHVGLRCSLQVYRPALLMHHGGFKPPCTLARHYSKSKYSRIKWKDFTAVLSFFFFFFLLPIHSYSRAAWAQLSFSSDSKGMCSGQPPRSQSCWKVSPFAGEHTTNLCFGPEEAAECARNNQAKKEGKKTAVGFANERQILNVWFLCHEIKRKEEEEGQDEKWRQINIIRPGLDTTTALSLPRIPELKKNEIKAFLYPFSSFSISPTCSRSLHHHYWSAAHLLHL